MCLKTRLAAKTHMQATQAEHFNSQVILLAPILSMAVTAEAKQSMVQRGGSLVV